MITQEIVFVLGAGASCPYGLPTGQGLRQMLCADLRNESSNMFKRLHACGANAGIVRVFAEAFLRSGRTSIDAFLATRQDFHEVGVLAIANALLPLEQMDRLYLGEGHSVTSDWYQHIWARMIDGVHKPEDFQANKVRFITFNYDRSLEVFLEWALIHSFNLPPPDAHDLLPLIHHVYGSLGEYDPNVGFRYGQHSVEGIKLAANLIKTVPSTRPPRDETAAAWLKRAKQIYFVGFGFDEMNCRRLGIADVVAERATNRQHTTLMGTSLGMTGGEETIARRHTGCASGPGSLNLEPMTGLSFVREIAHQLT